MKKRKISILTFAKGDNYGGVLQAYSLGEVLRRMGHDVQFIYLTWTNWKYALVAHLSPLARRFEKFRKRYLVDFTKRCYTKEELAEVVKGSDLCIVGSDQVWNPIITTIRAKHYFFDFLPEDMPRISYAASFGVDEWKWPELTEDIKELLKKFNGVSVRENGAVRICENEFDVSATHVLDPTLLLGDFKQFLHPRKHKEPYLLGFKFAPSDNYYNIIEIISGEMGIKPKLLDILTKHISKKALKLNQIFFASPERWLNEIAGASFVVTDSFHGLAFCLIFEKDFVIYPTSKFNHMLKGRMYSLLEKLDLTDRIYYNLENMVRDEIWKKKIDYTKVNSKLAEMRKESMDFLNKSIESLG